MVGNGAPATKNELRAALLATRRGMADDERNAEAEALCSHLDSLAHDGGTACAYVPVRSEPGSIQLIESLRGGGFRVLLPIARHGDDGAPQPLRWAEYRPGGLVAAPFGLREPAPPWLPPEAVSAAAIILVPALAVDRRGARLGRGAGFYDRTLGLAAPGAMLIAVVRDDELVDRLPAEPHDVRMTHALAPSRGLVALTDGRR